MSKRFIVFCVAYLLVMTCSTAFGQVLGDPVGPRELRITASTIPDTLPSIQHKEAAMALAAGDPVLMKAWSFFCTPTRYNVPGVELEPAKVFDNLYAIPSSPDQQTIVYAISTNDGIILLDAGYRPSAEAFVANMRKVGLDPAKVKYILLGHGHGDHYGNALYFQQTYGTKVGTTAEEWDLMYPANAQGNGGDSNRPKRDLVVKEGTPVQLGEQTVHLVHIPGHTPGSLAFIFTVRENGQTHTAGLFGGTIQDQPRISNAGLNQYLQSIRHYLDTAKMMKVDVEIQNHALFDDTPRRLAMLKTRKKGEPNPFLMPTEKYVSLWTLVTECIQAELAKRPK
jgi:metallo-beta-lactamase class B